MDKKFEDDELKKLLEDEYVKEAEAIVEALFSDDQFDDEDITDEEIHDSYDRLIERLKAEGIYEPDDEAASDVPNDEVSGTMPETKVIPMPEKDNTRDKNSSRIFYKFAKAASIAAVTLLGIFAVTMTSEANRNYFIETVRYLAGDDTRMVIDNNEGNERGEDDEYSAIEKIKKLGIDMPLLMYRPENFDFYDYKINSSGNLAYLEYIYKDTVITLLAEKRDEKKASDNFSLHGKQLTTIPLEDSGVLVEVSEVQGPQDKKPSYTAQWDLDDIFYQISGKMEKDEFLKLVEKVRY